MFKRLLSVGGFTLLSRITGFARDALLAWTIGIAAYQALSRLAPDTGATLPAFAVSAVAYVGFRMAGRRKAYA